MSLLYFSDILEKAGLDPVKVKLIRHSLTDKTFKECFDSDMVYEYTCHQKKDFSKGYDYWAVFISGSGTLAKFHSVYRVGDSKSDTKKTIPKGLPKKEASHYTGNGAVYSLEKIDALNDMEGKLTIDWGKSTRMWHQRGTTPKPVISILPDEKKIFTGYEKLIKSYDELKDIIENPEIYDSWHTALSSVYAIYLIVDTETGQQYIGSAYGKDGLLGRWTDYIRTHHGNNKKIKEIICNYPDRYHAFQFSILQILPKNLSDEEVINIERLWKDKLLCIKFGMNKN